MQSVSSNYLVQTSAKVRQKMEFSSGVSPEVATSGTTKEHKCGLILFEIWYFPSNPVLEY